MNKQATGDGTVGKALEILELIAELGRPVRFSELLTNSAHPKATLYRLVQTLTNQGMLTYDEDRQTYAPGLRLVRLAHAAWRQSSLAPIARPHVDALADKLGQTVHLAQIDNGQVLYVDKRNAAQPVEMFSQAGKVGPGYCTGVGKAMMAYLEPEAQARAVQRQAYFAHTQNTLTNAVELLSELDQIREEGIAFDREEHEPGIICIAAPILNSRKRVLGAVSLTMSGTCADIPKLKTLKPDLIQTARDIAEAAETWQFPS